MVSIVTRASLLFGEDTCLTITGGSHETFRAVEHRVRRSPGRLSYGNGHHSRGYAVAERAGGGVTSSAVHESVADSRGRLSLACRHGQERRILARPFRSRPH